MQKISNTILGRYHVREEIGAGAMGVVYRATDPLLERDVAIKTIRIDVTAAEREEFKKRFFREAKSAARLNHPNIVTVYDAGETGDVAFIAMELLDGRDLRNYISLTERMPLESCAQIVADVARALHYAHAEGVIHRDVKPGNIILLNSGVVKLADFGIASLANSAATQTGQMFGTPKYMAPEQIAGRPADGRTDIFSLGIVLYQLITGVAPFDGDSFSSIMFRVMQEPAVAPSDLVPDLPAGFEYVVSKALAKDPNNRYQNAGQMDLDLRNLALSNDVQALPWGLGGVRKMADAPVGLQPLTNAWDATQVFDRPKVVKAAPAAPHLPDPLELAAQMDAEDAKRADFVRLEDALAAKLNKEAKAQPTHGVTAAATSIATGSTALSTAGSAAAAAPMQVGLAKGVEESRKLEAAEEAARHANASTVPLSADAIKAKQAVKSSQANQAKTESGKSSSAKTGDAAKPVSGKQSSAAITFSEGTKSPKDATTKRSKLKLFGTAAAGIAALGVGLYALQHSGSGGKTPVLTAPIATGSPVAAPAVAASQPAAVAAPLTSASAVVANLAASAAQASVSSPVTVASAAADTASAAAPDAAAVQDGRLSIAVAPWGEVYVNGQYRGVSPPMTELLLPPGSYQVQIRNSEFAPFEQKVTIEAGKRRRITTKFR